MHKYVEQVQQLKQKPEHIRHRIALGTSIGFTVLIAAIWLVGSAANGKFALKGPGGDTGGQTPTPDLGNTKSEFSQLIGSAASAIGATSSPAAITVVDGGTSSTIHDAPAASPTAPSDATAISF